MGGFWKLGNNWRNMKMGARHALTDVDLYAGGIMELQKATQLMDIEDKLKQGADLTDAEVSLVYSTMLGQDVRDNTDTPHGYNAAQITVEMFPFMAQMALNPASGLSRAMVTKFGKSGLRKIAMKKAAQGLTGEAADKFAKKEMRKLAAKTVGIQVLGDVTEATVLANTLQAPKTAANAIERYQGDVVEDDKGNISFDGNHNWGEAIYKAEASAIIENYTEMLGEHFGIIGSSIGKGVGKGLRAIGGGRVVDAVSDMIGKIGSSEWARAIGKVEKRAHWNGTVGEVLEEEAGIVLNSIFTGDNKISDLWDADQQIDIVLGVGLFGGFVSGIKSVGYPIAKSRAKGNLRKRNSIGSWRFGDEWEGIRAEIENAEEKNLGTVTRDIVRIHAKSDEQGKAIVEYAHALMNARGHEIASASVRSDGNITPEQQDIEDSFEHGEQLAESEDAQAMNDAKKMLDLQRQRLASALSEDLVQDFDNDPIGALSNTHDPELRIIASDYVNAKMVYDGMIQRVRDDVDGRIAQSDAMIDSRVNRETGMIQPATMKIDDRKVYIVNGTVSMYEDGTGVDAQNSSESIIIRDAETGKVEFADPTQFLNVDEAIDVETEKDEARNQIINEIAVAAANNIDGVLSFNPGDTYTILDVEGNQQSISVLGQTTDENGMPIDGYVDIQFPDGSIESVATSDVQQWVDAANTQRVEQFDNEHQTQRAAEVEATRQADQSGLSNPNRRTDLMPDDYKMPYDNRPVVASRYIESENGTGGTLYQDEDGNDAVVIAAIDDNNYVGYFREYDEQGNPTNRWSAKFQNGSGLRENHRDMMLTAQELLPAGHELTEHTSVSTDGLRNLANQLKHGYELQYDEQGNIVTTEVAVNMMARENELGLSDYEPGSIDPARVTSEEYKEAATRLIPYMEALGLSKFNIHWEDGTLYVDHPILRRADTPQHEEQPAVPENAETVPNSTENAEIPTETRDLDTENVPKTEIPVENVQQAADDGFIPIDPNIKPDENGVINIPSPGTAEVDAMLAPEEPKPSALSQIPVDEKGEPVYEQAEAGTAWDAIVEQAKGDEDKAQRVVESMLADMQAEVKRLEKQKPQKARTVAEKMAAEDALEAARAMAQANLDKWTEIAGIRESRVTEAQRLEAEAALRSQIQAEQEARRAERQARDEERASRPAEYANAMSGWEDPTTLEEKILRDLAGGGIKIRWADKGRSHGLGAHLFGGRNTERRWDGEYGNYKWLVDDANGLLPEEYAERLEQEYYNDYENGTDHRAEVFDAVLDVLRSYPSSRDMWGRVQELHQGNLDAEAAAEDFERLELETRGITQEDIDRDSYYRENYGMTEDEWDEFYMTNGAEIDLSDAEYSELFNNLASLRADQENEQKGLQQAASHPGEQGGANAVGADGTGMVRGTGLYRPEAPEVWRPEGNGQESGGDVSLRNDEGGGEGEDVTSSPVSVADPEEQEAEEDALRSRIEVKDDDWTEGEGYSPTLKRTVVIDGIHNVTQVDTPNEKGDYTGSVFEYDGKTFGDLREVISHIDDSQPATIGEQIAEAEAEVNTDPTDKQKEAGNYRKGHVQVGAFDVTIENPKGSKRSGTDADGKKWETTMTHTYGYIRGTKGVDGDHIDVYISSDVDDWNGRKVFVVDQYNPDGSFDEHKVMLGFNDRDEAFEAYLSNYEKGWEKGRRLDITEVNLEDFEKWIDSSKRKRKAFADYKSMKAILYDNQGNPIDENGNLVIEDVESISDITDIDFNAPSRTVGLPALPGIVQQVLSTNGKRVIIKKNIFKRNALRHDELTPEMSRRILTEALYNPTLYGKNKPLSRPNNWIVINVPDGKGNNKLVVLEVNENKDNIEIVHWHEADKRGLEKIKRQAEREDGQLLILPSETSEEAGALSGPTFDSPSDGKVNTFVADNQISKEAKRLSADKTSEKQTESAESSDGYSIEPRKDTRDNSDIFAVKFDERVSRDAFKTQKSIAKKHGGYWSNFGKKGFLFKTREEAEAFANEVMGNDKTQLSEDAPLSIDDMQSAIKPTSEETTAEKTEISSSSEETTAEKKAVNPSGNKLVTDEQYAELLAKMRKKMGGQLNMGVDPEVLAIGSMMAVYHIEKGARKFAEYVKAMVADLGEKFPARYLKGFYKAAHEMIEDAAPEIAVEMDSDDVVNTADVASIINGRIDAMATAKMVVEEETAEQEREEAERKLKDERNVRLNPDGSTSETVTEGGTEIEVTQGDFIPGIYPPVNEPKKPGKKKTPKPKPEAELSGDSAEYQERTRQERDLVDDIAIEIVKRTDMKERGDDRGALTIRDIRGMLENYNLLTDISATDLQELVERAMTILTRTAAKTNQSDPRKGYNRVVGYYNMQPSLNARDSERLIKQQYSTPTPFGYVMGQFVNAKNDVKSVLEPSAGNGALTIMFDPATVHVNDIDERRLENLRTLGYGTVTAQNGLLPFEGVQVDGVLTNPPFGTVAEKVYDGVFKISSLEGQMTINALDSMKDGGRAAIIIGGNTSYRTNGSMNPKDAAFFGYLYSHYNVADVINISGKALYSRNGTGYDVRMILIDGRKTGEFQRVFPPVQAKARAEQVTTFDELYKRVQDDIQQIQQMGSQLANVQREPETAADGTASAPVRTGNNRPNGIPGTTGDVLRGASKSDSGQPTPGNDGSRPAGVDNADGGNGTGVNDVPRGDRPKSGQREQHIGVDNGRGRSGDDGRGTTTSRPDRSAERLAVKPDLTTEKVPYPNQSENGFTLMSVVPAAQAQVLQKSLGEIGDVDQFLVDELGYSSKNELYHYLAAEQIDSVALAIHQMNKGNAFIIGDMTGVGKGRQGAALIRYAVKQGRVPIYFTQKPTLFTDNYRDLADIGSSDLRPFIIASNPKDANIVDADGNVVHKLPSKKEQERVFNYIMEHGTLPDEYDYVLTTYDQIKNGTADYTQNEDGTWNTEARKLPKKSKGYTTADYNGQARRDALARLAEGNIAILDESHTVGGDSGCGRYMQMLTSSAEGVTFLSATFAKRADNMPIYAQRTAIAEAGVKASELIEAISKGGVTLQEIMSKQLVESGQMIRRERSFEGVTIDWLSVEEETNRRQRQQFNEVADIFNAIRNFQDDYITPIIDAKNEAAAEFGATVGHTQGTKDLGVKNVPFASKMYNLVNQLLFALKVDAVADRVIENLRNGYKPVISFTNTMEGFLSSAPKGVAMDDVPNFSLTLMRALDGVMRFTEKDADENSEGGSISLSELSTEGQNAYNAIRDKIMNLSADLPISPMDAIRMKIEEAGYSVAEITGRTMQLNRTDDGRYVVEARKDRDKKAAMRDFNSGKLDVLMINKSGSTGISLHASSKFEDQRPRVMVFAQFQSDINDEVQMRGRIDRSGQVTRGRYEYIMSTIPAEQRIQMMFKAKLKSLDANTTSSQKSKFNEMEIVDYLNKYGDDVVWEYMKEHPELEERLGDPLDMLQEKKAEDGPRTSEKEDTSKKTGCAGKISRYLAFLSVEEQDEIFREITEAYRVKIQLLDDAGENDLEITTMPLRAETKQKKIWHEGENPGSGNAFADNTYVEEVEVDVLKKPMKRDEIVEATRKLMGEHYTEKNGGVDWQHYVRAKGDEISLFFQAKEDEAIGKLREAGEARIAKAREKAVTAATKARGRGENNFTDEQIQSLADTVANEEREKELQKQRKRQEEIMAIKHRLQSLLQRLRAGGIYVVPQDLKQGTAEMFTQTFGTFVGFKFNKGYTLGSSTAIFATLDGRRKVELALSDQAINTIISATDIANRYSPDEIRAISLENWDSKVPTQTRQKRYIITGNLLQALVDTEKGEKTRGNLISYSTIDGETRQGILMGENFKLTDLRNSASLSSRLAQIREGKAVVSENGDVQISKELYDWRYRGQYELRVPKSKIRGGIYTMHPDLLKLVDGHNFITKGNKMVAYVEEANIAKVVDLLSREPFNLTVIQESQLSDVSAEEAEGDVLYRANDMNDIISAKDMAKFGDADRKVVEDYIAKYPSAPIVVVRDGSDVDLLADIGEDIRDCLKEALNDLHNAGVYSRDTKKIYIFADKRAIAPLHETLVHENMHAVVDSLGDGCRPFLSAFASSVAASPYNNGVFGSIYDAVKEDYHGDNVNDEFLAYVVQYGVRYPKVLEAVKKALDDSTLEYFNNIILKNLYETEGQSITRSGERAAGEGADGPLSGLAQENNGAHGGNSGRRHGDAGDPAEGIERHEGGREHGGRVDGPLSRQAGDADSRFENDPLSKAWGESIRTKRQQRQFAERERGRMRERVKSLSSILGLDIEVIEDASALKGRKQGVKGWYETKTGKITVVVSNNNSASDMEATILHEAVAHHGLRQLLGGHFDEFLDKVYEAAENGIKEQIDLLASRNGWNRRVATEEYLAGLAERTDFDGAEERIGGWFDKIKRFFFDMLLKAGFKYIKPGSIGDNELRYILWRSYQNLVNPGRYRAFEWEAEDVAMQYKLQVGAYGVSEKELMIASERTIEEAVNERFNEELERWESMSMRPEEIVNAGYPMGIMRQFMPDVPIIIRQKVLSKSRKKHGLTSREMHDLPGALANPIFVFKSSEETVSVLTTLKSDSGENLFVAVELEKDLKLGGRTMEVNDILTIHRRETENVILPIVANGSLVWVDKNKGLEWLHSAKSNSQAITAQTLEDAAKIVKDFENPTTEEEDKLLFRAGNVNQTARQEYDERVRTKKKEDPSNKAATKATNRLGQLNEAYLDSMRALKILQEAVSHETGRPVEDHENAYISENAMSSRNKTQEEAYSRDFFKPLCDAVANLLEGDKKRYKGLINYILAKHGLERNVYMRAKAVADGTDQSKADNTDFAGLTALTGKKRVTDAETSAQKMVDDYEAVHDTSELWSRIREATEETLRIRYTSGLLSKDMYEQIRRQYQFYIPLKGWADTTAADVYEYSANGYGLSPALMTAYGRRSVADDPLATIMTDAQRTIMEANRNIMKQKLLNLALNHRTSLLSVGKQWYVRQADGTWAEDNPMIPPDADADMVDSILKQHEAAMEALAKQRKAHTRRAKLRLGMNRKSVDKSQHLVEVKRNGTTYRIYVCGDPRAARAVNGILNPDAGEQTTMKKAAQKVKNFMSRAFTSLNPEFVVGNLLRDLMFAGIAVKIKEDNQYAKAYTKNMMTLLKAKLPILLYKWEHGQLDDKKEMERMFKEFLMNGGETGFTQLNTVEKTKKQMQRFLEESKGGAATLPGKAWRGFWNGVEFLNRSAEDTTRFAVYMTSRQQGRTIGRSIWDAKEITVNFNKKGSGALGARYMNFAYIFFNACIQSAANAGRIIKYHPVKSGIAGGCFLASGFLMPMINIVLQALCGGCDGDDDDYWKLPEWTRRNNVCIYIPWTRKFFTIPIAHELRPFYGAGEIAFSVLMGKETTEDGVVKAIEGLSGMLPIDYTGNGGDNVVNFAPTIAQPVVQIYRNVDYFGKPIYKKTPWNGDDPEWMKAYKSTSPFLVDLTRMLSEAAATTDEFDVKEYPRHWYSGDINPAMLEHLFEGYFGGLGKTINGVGKTFSMLWDADSRELRNVPVVRKFLQNVDERAEERKVSNDYFKYKKEYDAGKIYLRKLTQLDDDGAIGAANRVSIWIDTEEGKRFLILEDYFKEIESLQRSAKQADTDSILQAINMDITDTKHKLIHEMDSINAASK